VEDTFGVLYYAKDNYYQVPQTYCSLEFLTPSIDAGDHKKAALIDLYVKAARESLNNVLYPAQMAGLSVDIDSKTYGLTVEILGYDERVPDLLKAVLVGLKQLRPSQKQFERYREGLMQTYRNFEAEPLLTQTVQALASVLNKDYSTSKQKLRAIQHLSYQEFVDYAEKLFAQNYVAGLFYGNLTEAQAKAMATTVRESVGGQPFPAKQHHTREIADLSTLSAPRFLVETTRSTGNAIILTLESGAFSYPLYGTQAILTQAIQSPFFATLRTRQQTGYAVTNWQQELERRLFLFFAVESDSHDARDLLARFELFLEDFQRTLDDGGFTEEEFGHIRAALIDELERPAQDMVSMGTILSALITDYQADFNWIQRRIAGLKALSYNEFLLSSKKILSTSNHKRLAVIMKGTRKSPDLLQYRWSKSVKETRKELDYEPADHVMSKNRLSSETTSEQ
jgi:insulysin